MRRWILVAAAAGLVAVLALVSEGTVVILDPEAVEGYRVSYRLEDRVGGTRDVRTEVVEVSRPYSGRVEQHFREGLRSGRVTNREYLWQLGEGGKLLFGVLRPPGGPARDGSYQALVDAWSDGVIDAGGAGEALGRRCTWFAYREPAPKALEPPTPSSRVESCVDAGGIVLRETWTFDGRTARLIEAVDIDVGPPRPGRFLEGRHPGMEATGPADLEALLQAGFAVADNVDTTGVGGLDIDVPSGWEADRNSLVAIGGGGQDANPTQFSSDTFVRGGEIVVVERGTSPTLTPPWGPGEGSPLTIGTAGEGRLVYFADRVEIRLVGDLGFARVLAPDRRTAMRFATGLRPAA